MGPVKLEPGTSQSHVKHSTTEPLFFMDCFCSMNSSDLQLISVVRGQKFHSSARNHK